MLLEIAVADAYSIAFEFVQEPEKHGLINDLATYQQHPEYSKLKPSQYTDDTQRTIATGWTICSGDFHDPINYISSLQNQFRENPRDGYSRRFQALMEEMKDKPPENFLRAIKHKKASNGSVMGVLPCGFLPDVADVRLAATIQAISTHSIETVPYAQRLALAAHYFIFDVGEHDDKVEFLRFILDESEGSTDFEYRTPRGPVSMDASATADEVLRLLMSHTKLSELLRHAVDLKGDTDSVAALAVGLASLSNAYEKDLPQALIDGVEFGSAWFKDDVAYLEETLWMVSKEG